MPGSNPSDGRGNSAMDGWIQCHSPVGHSVALVNSSHHVSGCRTVSAKPAGDQRPILGRCKAAAGPWAAATDIARVAGALRRRLGSPSSSAPSNLVLLFLLLSPSTFLPLSILHSLLLFGLFSSSSSSALITQASASLPFPPGLPDSRPPPSPVAFSFFKPSPPRSMAGANR